MNLPWTLQTFTIFSGRFDCCRFFATFCKHSIQTSKHLYRQLTNIFSKKWWHVHQTAPVYGWKIGLLIYHRIKLAINSLVSFRTFWMVIQNCASSKTRHGEFTLSLWHVFWRHAYSLEKCYQIIASKIEHLYTEPVKIEYR